MKQFLIGSYAPEGEPSIFSVELDEEKQKLRLLWEDGQVQNPSFLYLHPNCHVLYAVEERVPNGGLAVMIKTEEGWLLKERLLAGSAPCHLEMTPDARYLLVSNYMDGTIGVYRADESGSNGFGSSSRQGRKSDAAGRSPCSFVPRDWRKDIFRGFGAGYDFRV